MKSSFEPVPGPSPSPFVPFDGGGSAEAGEVASSACPDAEALAERLAVVEAPDPAPLLAAAAAFERGLDALRESQREFHRRCLWGALDVGVALAKRVLERELSLDPEALHPLLERALDRLDAPERAEVMLAPQDLERAGEAAGESLSRLRAREDVTFAADPQLAPGEARVRAGASSIDLRLEPLLSMLRDELVPEWEQEQESQPAQEWEPGAR